MHEGCGLCICLQVTVLWVWWALRSFMQLLSQPLSLISRSFFWLAFRPVTLGWRIAEVSKTVAPQSWIGRVHDRRRWEEPCFLWGRLPTPFDCEGDRLGGELRRAGLQSRHWHTWCKPLAFLLQTFPCQRRLHGLLLEFPPPIGGVQWLVLFGQEVLVQVIRFDSMHLGCKILVGEPKVDSTLPHKKNNRAFHAGEDISQLVACKQAPGNLHELLACDGSAGIVGVFMVHVIGRKALIQFLVWALRGCNDQMRFVWRSRRIWGPQWMEMFSRLGSSRKIPS